MKIHLPPWTSTLKFRLTLWYSMLLIIAVFFMLLIVNFVVTDHFQRSINESVPLRLFSQIEVYGNTGVQSNANKTLREVIQEIRLQDLYRVQQMLLVSFIVLSLLSFAGGYVIADQMLSPLRKLDQAMKQVSGKNFSVSLPEAGANDEVGRLIKNFNSMISRLQSVFAAQSSFTQNAAHELKTPMSAMRINLDSLRLQLPQSASITELDDAIKAIEFMDKLLEDLLLLSAIDSNEFPSLRVDMQTLAAKSLKQLQFMATENDILLHLDSSIDNAWVVGSEPLLQRALMNLVENAIKYSKRGQEIRITLSKSDGLLEICVVDKGSGIPAEHLERIFERFYRVDKSRSRLTGGSGLGLAIVRDIVNHHSGSVEVTSQPKRGTTFIIRLPLSRSGDEEPTKVD